MCNSISSFSHSSSHIKGSAESGDTEAYEGVRFQREDHAVDALAVNCDITATALLLLATAVAPQRR